MDSSPTVNLVSGRLVACYENTCEIYHEGSWQHLQNTAVRRAAHSSATTEGERVLLIGGEGSNSTEWIPAAEGSAGQPGPFAVRHGYSHCTIQISDGILVVTGGGWAGGGLNTESYVTQYDLDDGSESLLTPLGQPRRSHACGVYKDADDQQVSKRLGNTKTNTQIQIKRHKYTKTKSLPGRRQPTNKFKACAVWG